jgi:glycosyltransferase involved in cell wall biosynthesis
LTKIAIVASNSILRHPRIWKIANSLKKKYEMSAFGWNREGISSQDINRYIVPLSLYRIKAPFGRLTLVLYYPLFWGWILFKLLANRPSVVHAIDLDTLLPCSLYRLILRKKLVYDVHDRFGGYVPPKYRTLFKSINLVEELLSKQADVLVTVSEKVQDTFRLRPKHCAIIMNFSEDYNLNKSKSEDGILTLVYTGLISKDQGLDILTAALEDLKGVRLVLAGRIADKELLENMTKLPNVTYVGLLERADSLKLEASSDAMVVLYDLQYRKNQLSSPNKIFEAMMCGIPLITNMEVNLVNEIDCGITVEYNIEQVKDAIRKLRDDSALRTRLGNNGRKAFVEKYNWDNMEKKLYQIYSNLLNERMN